MQQGRLRLTGDMIFQSVDNRLNSRCFARVQPPTVGGEIELMTEAMLCVDLHPIVTPCIGLGRRSEMIVWLEDVAADCEPRSTTPFRRKVAKR